MDNYQRGYRSAQGPQSLSITTDREHSHHAGMVPPEIEIFLDQHLLGEPGLPVVGETRTDGEQVSTTVESEVPGYGGRTRLHLRRPDFARERVAARSGPGRGGRATATLPSPGPKRTS